MDDRLEKYLMTLEGKPFQWGTNDCWTLVRGWLKVVGGWDELIDEVDKEMIGGDDAIRSRKKMNNAGLTLSPKLLTDKLNGELKSAMYCREGSIAIVPIPVNKGWRLGIVDDGGSVVGLTERGLVRETHPNALGVEIE